MALTTEVEISHWAVKEAVFPFDRFDGVDTLLGPEMKSTGEVMGIDDNLGLAIGKGTLWQQALHFRHSAMSLFQSATVTNRQLYRLPRR